MVIQERTDLNIRNIQRMAIRRIPLNMIENAYRDLLSGRTERSVCQAIGVNFDIFKGVLIQALREALWERGYVSFVQDLSPMV